MALITTRADKGSPLTNNEIDANFTSLNDNKLEAYIVTIVTAPIITPPASCTQYNVTALAESLEVQHSGTPAIGHRLIFRIKDDGISRAISWVSAYRGVGGALPSATVPSKLLYIGFSWNPSENYWDMLSMVQQA